jgi:REP element-mobilizing transposase RayT
MFVTVCAGDGVRLTDAAVAKVLVEAMGRIGRRRGTRVNAYCLMPDHVHVVLSADASGGDMAGWLTYWKRETAKVLKQPGMWRRSFWDRHARDDEDAIGMVEYALHNPVRERLCESWTHWPHSWSQWHSNTLGTDPNL